MEKFCNVYLIHEMILNNQKHVKKIYSLNWNEKVDKNGAEKLGREMDECVIQTAHKIPALRHVLNHKMDDRNNKNNTKVFKI